MGVRVEVRDGEPLQQAIRRLSLDVRYTYRRTWYKRRFGYYEKRSIRQRRKKRLQQRNRFMYQLQRTHVKMYMGLKTLHSREGGFP